MKNITDASVLAEVNLRLDKLNADTPRKWGVMTPAQMLWHCRQQLRLSNGQLKVKDMFPAPVRWLLKKTFANRVPFGKSMGTIPGIEADKIENLNFDDEKSALKTSLNDFVKMPTENIVKTHPIFGKMEEGDWGKIVYKHLDHHFSQFGV